MKSRRFCCRVCRWPPWRGIRVGCLKAAGCEKVFREKIIGTTADRP
jgi:hypothetical protein